MDFLDPKAKKRRGIRLMVGYVLVACLILIASTVLVFKSYGFDLDRRTGEVIQNGLVYVDSAPNGADVYLNGERFKNQTNFKAALQEGKYDLTIKKAGYRDWQTSFDLRGGSVQRITYPLLLLADLDEPEIANFGKVSPELSSQSPDRKWLLVSKNDTFREYTEYDLGSIDRNSRLPEQRGLVLPDNVLTESKANSSIEEVEWSTDNQHLLVKHTYDEATEFIVIDRKNPAKSLNINKLLDLKPDKVSLIDKKYDKWYIYQQKGGVLRTANIKKQITPVLTEVTSYKSHDDSILLYSRLDAKDSQGIYLQQDNKTNLIRQAPAGSKIFLDIAKYDDRWYSVMSVADEAKTYIYEDLHRTFSITPQQKPVPEAVLRNKGHVQQVGFSANTQFVLSRSGESVAVYDAEYMKNYSYTLQTPMDKGTELRWMDGHRLLYRSSGLATIVDFNGSNTQPLLKALPGNRVFFDRDYEVMYTIVNSQKTRSTIGLVSSDLRAEQDK